MDNIENNDQNSVTRQSQEQKPLTNVPRKSIMKTSKYSIEQKNDSKHSSNSNFRKSSRPSMQNSSNKIFSHKGLSSKKAIILEPVSLAATAGPENFNPVSLAATEGPENFNANVILALHMEELKNDSKRNIEILKTEEFDDVDEQLSANVLNDDVNSLSDSKFSHKNENLEGSQNPSKSKAPTDQKSSRNNITQSILRSSVYAKKRDEIQNCITKDNYLEYIIKVLKVPPKQRSQMEIEILLKATINLKFFLDMTRKKLEIELQTHLKSCKTQHYEKFERGSAVVEVDEQPTRFFVILDGLTGVYVKRKVPMEQEQIVVEKIEEKINSFKEREIKWKELKDICTKKNGFSEEEITSSLNFKTVKNGFLQYKQEFLDKFMGGLDPDELERRSILFNPDGTLKLMHVAQIPKGAVFGELGILQKKRRAATIICKCTTEMGFIFREDYERCILEVEKTKMDKKKRFFGETVFKSSISLDIAYSIGYNFEKFSFARGEHVYRQGDKHSKQKKMYVYVIKSGSVLAYVNEKFDNRPGENDKVKSLSVNLNCNKKRNLVYLSDGELFGDDEINAGVCNTSVVCQTATKVLRLDRDAWAKQLRDNKDLREFVLERIKVKCMSRGNWTNNQKMVEKLRIVDYPNDPNLKHITKTDYRETMQASKYVNDRPDQIKDVQMQTTGDPNTDKNTRVDVISQKTGFLSKLRKINNYSQKGEFQKQYAKMTHLEKNTLANIDDTSLDGLKYEAEDHNTSPTQRRKRYADQIKMDKASQLKNSVDNENCTDQSKMETKSKKNSIVSNLLSSPMKFTHMKYIIHEKIKSQLNTVRSKSKALESLRTPNMGSSRSKTLENEKSMDGEVFEIQDYNRNMFYTHDAVINTENNASNLLNSNVMSKSVHQEQSPLLTKNVNMKIYNRYENEEKTDAKFYVERDFIRKQNLKKSIKTDMRNSNVFSNQKSKKNSTKIHGGSVLYKTSRTHVPDPIKKSILLKNEAITARQNRNLSGVKPNCQNSHGPKIIDRNKNSKDNLINCVKTRSLTHSIHSARLAESKLPLKIHVSMNHNIFPIKHELNDMNIKNCKAIVSQELSIDHDIFKSHEIGDLRSKLESIMAEKDAKSVTIHRDNMQCLNDKLGFNSPADISTMCRQSKSIADDLALKYEMNSEDFVKKNESVEHERRRKAKYKKHQIISSKHNMFRMLPTLNTNLLNYKKYTHANYQKKHNKIIEFYII